MASDYETFFDNHSFAVVGHSADKPFPELTYRGLKRNGKKVFAVDPSTDTIDGDPSYSELEALPDKVDAIIIEGPREQTRDWIAKAAKAGIRDARLYSGWITCRSST